MMPFFLFDLMNTIAFIRIADRMPVAAISICGSFLTGISQLQNMDESGVTVVHVRYSIRSNLLLNVNRCHIGRVRRGLMRWIFRSVCLLASILVVAAQQPKATPSAPARVDGTIVDGISNKPVSGVSVIALQGNDRHTVTTDAQGKFTFAVTYGTIRIRTTKNGYSDIRPAGHTFPTDGVLIGLAPNQQLRGVTLPVFPTGSVSGTVYDSKSKPVQYAQIQLLRYWYDDAGDRALRPISIGRTVETNDHGEFHVSDIDAGAYYVLVNPPVLGERVPGEPFIPVYYPATTDSFRASTIEVKSAAETRLEDITLPSAPGAKIRLRLMNQTGETIQNSSWLKYLYWRHSGDATSSGLTVFMPLLIMGGPERAEIPVTPGRYDIIAGWAANGGATKGLGNASLDVGRLDVNVDVVVRKGVKVTARATSSGVRCDLNANGYGASGLSAAASADGTMTWDNVQPARYRMGCTVLAADTYLLEIKQGDRDVIKDGLVVSNNEETNVFSVSLGTGGGIAEGTVTDTKGMKVAGSTVVLIPDEPLRESKQLYRTATTDQNGAFSIRTIAPGLYHVFAWQELEGAAYKNAGFMKTQEQPGTPVKIDRGGKVTGLKVTQ
jgi:hypothetical protein